MASEQAKRGKVTFEHEVEKDRVPKMATHFESLAEKDAGGAAAPSLEEISNMRGAAQQNSIEAIRAAEERYHKAKGEKPEAAKDVAVEGGKGAAGYAGKVKDQAVVATQYTLGKVVDATKAVASVTSSVAVYTKDKLAGAGGHAGEKQASAKDDEVVATEEKSADDAAARKKAEAQKSARGSEGHDRDEGGVSLGCKEEHGEGKETSSDGAGTVLEAVGETVVEIGQTTKDLLVGQYPADQGKAGK